MANRIWSLELEGRTHQIRLEHSYWSGKTVLRIDDVVAMRDAPGFAGFADHWFGPTEHATRLGAHELRLRITPTDSYSFDLIVDGRSVSSGELVPPLARPPRDSFYRLGKLGVSVGMIAVPYLLVTTFMFGRFAPEWGPRWFAANDLALESGVLPLSGGLGLYLVNVVRVRSSLPTRLIEGIFGLASLWVAAVSALELPLQIADVIREPETLNVMVVESTASNSGHAPTIRTADGATYQWVWSFGLYAYPTINPGKYQIVLTGARHRLVAIRSAT